MENKLIFLRFIKCDNSKNKIAEYLCFCGNVFSTRISNVNTKHTKSCGCLKTSVKNLSSSRLYVIWINMIRRCYDPKVKAYKNYGARGITVCSAWKNSFLSFYYWAINNGYSETLTLDRENNDKEYSSTNCRWANLTIQARNKRMSEFNTSGYTGVSKDGKQWRAYIHINNKYIHIGNASSPSECAIMRNEYIIKNNTGHKLNKL